MPSLLLKLTGFKIFSLLFIIALTSSLFYTGNNIWLFTTSYILIIFCFAIVLIQRFHNPIIIPINGIFISASLLLIWFAISILPSQIKYLSIYNFFWMGSILIIFLIFTFNENKDKIWHITWPLILLLVLIWAIYGLAQYYYFHVPSNATFLNRNSLAALINLALIPASGYFLLNQNDQPWSFLNKKLLGAILFILFLTTFIITSRGGSLSLLLGFTILFIFLKKYASKKYLYSLITIILISFSLSVISQYFINDLPSGFTERMFSLKDASESGNSRFIIWNSLLPLFSEMPWYGLGLGSLWFFWPPHRPASDTSAGFFAHNDYMQMTLEAGYPGILLLVILFIFILISFIRKIKNNPNATKLSTLHQVELIILFSALVTNAAHSFFTYNFYILPLLIISGLYLGRFNQLITINYKAVKTLPALKAYFKPIMYIISVTGVIFILCSYFFAISFSSYYNHKAKGLMLQNKYKASSLLFIKAQSLAPLMDNPFFGHAELLRRGADKLFMINKNNQASALIHLAHHNLNLAEKLNPLRPQIHHIRGLIYLRNQPEKAKSAFKKALLLNPRFLFSRIRLAKIHYKEGNLKLAMKILFQGIDYNYPSNAIMLDYMKYFAKLSREANVHRFAQRLEENIKIFIKNNP